VNTDQQILAIVERGFTLPDHLEFMPASRCWFVDERDVQVWLQTEQAHDLCAMHFARQAEGMGQSLRRNLGTMYLSLTRGDSAAAIAALHAALQPSGGEEE
jgi:hypothetical protein